ncbi:MAG: MATE family efflux transporter [Phycisphaerales bacterium]|nr:MATE family efflux transporter [Phycisphaerales bacterium]
MIDIELKPQLEKRRSRTSSDIRDVVKLSIPIVVANSCRMVMDVTDFFLISRTNDTDAMAAILPAQMIVWAYIVIGMGTLTILTTLASQSLGRGDRATCSAYAWQGLYLSGAFWIIGAAVWPLFPTLFALAHHEPRIEALENEYARICFWTVGTTIAATALSSYFNGIHRPHITMYTALEGVVVNGVVSYVLIFGKLGMPAMGIAGAAWGTVVGSAYRMARLWIAFCSERTHREFASRDTWRPDWGKMKNVLRVGGPSGLQWLSDVAVWAIFTVVLVGSYFGKTHQLATNAAWQYLRISFLPCLGVGMAISSLVGRSIGARDPDHAVRVTRIGTLCILAYMGAMSVVYFVARVPLLGWFSTDAEVIRIGSAVIICAAVFQVFDALGIGYNSALRGAGDTFVPSLVFIASHWLMVVGGGYLVATWFPEYGSVGPWVVASVLIVWLGVYQWWRWNSGAWRAIDVFKHDRPTAAPAEFGFPSLDVDAAAEPTGS